MGERQKGKIMTNLSSPNTDLTSLLVEIISFGTGGGSAGLMSSAKYIPELSNVGGGLCVRARVNAAARIQLQDIMISVLTEYSHSCVKTA